MEQGGFGLQMVSDGRQRFLLPEPIPPSLLCAPKEGRRQMGMTIGLERGVEHGWLEFLPPRHRHQGWTHRAQVWEARPITALDASGTGRIEVATVGGRE